MISVIIPNYNGIQFLHKCLTALKNQIYEDFEVIIIDNASSDCSAAYIKLKFPEIRIHKNKINKGFSGAINDGLRLATGDLIFLLNTDTIIERDCLLHLAAAAVRLPDIAMFGTKMVYMDGRINSAGICVSISGAAWDRGNGDSDEIMYNEECEIFGPCGGAALFRREIFDSIGGFDEDFFIFMEDIDFAFRARLAGYKAWYIPKAKVVHYHGGTAGVGTDTAVYYGNRNIIWCYLKNFPLNLMIISFPFFVIRNIGVFLFYIVQGMGGIAWKARVDAIKGLFTMFYKRREMRRKCNSSDLFRVFWPILR